MSVDFTKGTKIVVGIDFGTTNTTVSYMQDSGNAQTLTELKYGKSLIPSVIGFNGKNFVFGRDAINLQVDQKQLWRNLKSELGTKNKTYTIQYDDGSTETKTSQDLIVEFLKYIMSNINVHLASKPFAVVISSPAYFNQDQKVALQNCFTLAGYELISLISEPAAACICYGNDNYIVDNEQVMVIDIGGGTTDVAVVKYSQSQYDALPTSGNSSLGGKDFDDRIYNKVVEHLEKVLAKDKKEWLTNSLDIYIHTVVEQVKKDLTKHEKSEIILSNVIPTEFDGSKTFKYTLTRKEFSEWTKDLIDKAVYPINECLEFNALQKSQIKKIILVGGGSLTYGIRERIKQIFPSTPIILDSNAKFCVSKGNTLFGSFKKEYQKSIILEKINKSIGVLATDPNNPDEPFAKRKVIQIIHRGDDIPAYGSYTFRTSLHNQKDAEIILVQGEGYTMENCSYIGTVILPNIGVAKAGINKIVVELKVNNLGLLTVTASDTITFRKQEIDIKLDHSWTTGDYIKLQSAMKEQKKFEKEEENERNWTKYVKFWNQAHAKYKLMDAKDPLKPFVLQALKDIQAEIKAKNWPEVEELQKLYFNLVVQVHWD